MSEAWVTQRPWSLFLSPSFYAGFLSGLPTAVLCAPFDTIRVRMQVETFCEEKLKGSGLRSIVRNTIAEEGLRGLYTGFSVTLVAMPIQLSVYFAAYESSKQFFRAFGDFRASVLAAVAAGSLSNVITNPLWLIRTRMMTQRLHNTTKYQSLWQSLRVILREEGVGALFQGVSASQLGLVHVVVQFPLYEWMKKHTARDQQPTFWEMMYLSAVPKLIASAVSYPLEVLRSRLADANKTKEHSYNNLRELVKVSWRLEGLRGFYAGFWVNSLRILPATYATLWTYESAMHFFRKYKFTEITH